MAAGESGSGAVFKAIIQAVDRVSEPVQGIVNAVKGLTGVEAKAASEEKKLHSAGVKGGEEHLAIFKRISNHVRGLGGHFSELTGAVRQVGGAFAQMVAPLGALGGAGSLAGLVEMTNSAAEAFSQLRTSAEQAGVSVRQFATLSMAAKENDVSTQTLTTSLFRLGRVMGDVTAGKNKQAASLFSYLGIALKDANGHALSAAQVLPKLADAFQHTHSATARDTMAQTLFGRGGAALIPILLKGSAGLAAYNAEFRKVGYLPNKGGQQSLESFHSSWVQLTTAVSGFTMEVGTKLAPVLRPIIDQVTKWIAKNREWISTDIAADVGKLVKWVDAIDLHKVTHDMRSWVGAITSVTSSLGGAKVIIGAVTLALGSPLLGAVGSAISIMGSLKSVVTGIGVAIAANPIVAIGAAIAAAAYLIYDNWDVVRPYLLEFWDAIKVVWKAAISAIKFEIKSIVAPFEWVWKQIQPIVKNIRDSVQWAANSWAGRELGLGGPSHATPGAPRTPGLGGPPNASAGRPVFRGGPHTFAPRGAPARTVAHVQGKLETTIMFKGAPAGTRVHATAHGAAAPPKVEVGFAMPGVAMFD